MSGVEFPATAGASVWYRALVTGEQIAAGEIGTIQRLFLTAITKANLPAGACLFATSHDTRVDGLLEDAEDGVAGNVDAVFFSPASISAVPHVIARYGGEPSGPPDRARAALLVGTDSDWDLLPRFSH
jgi:hypothetical protein